MTELVERVAILETLMEAVLENHIPHIESDMSDMKKQNVWILRMVFLALAGLTANLIVMIVK